MTWPVAGQTGDMPVRYHTLPALAWYWHCLSLFPTIPAMKRKVMKARILRCFVAMAIRDEPSFDTNVLHFKILKPLLKRRIGITAFRIDELHHNENIDARLLQEIARSELVVADLTYERPSVYFEAGYAMGLKIPVVYTCRSDHLRRLSEYQVHFDLRQRNIVDWKEPRDRKFAKRLVSRIRNTMASLLRSRELDHKEAQAHQAFAKLSQEKRSQMLAQESAAFLRTLGFKTDALPRDLTGRNPRG